MISCDINGVCARSFSEDPTRKEKTGGDRYNLFAIIKGQGDIGQGQGECHIIGEALFISEKI